MASFDGAYESLIQGVSQQVPTSRLPGQVSEQVNMVSDLVTGLRRRTGSKFRRTLSSAGVDPKSVKAWRTEVGGVSAECLLNSNTGELIMLEQDGSKYGEEVVHRFQSNYLKAQDVGSIRSTGVGDSMFILNTEQIPTLETQAKETPFKSVGYVQVNGAAITTTFGVTVTGGGKSFSGTYTTPDGTQSEHAKFINAPHIAERLVKSLQGETWVHPTESSGKYVQDDPTTESNGNPVGGNGVSLHSVKGDTLIFRLNPLNPGAGRARFKVDMPEGFITEKRDDSVAFMGLHFTINKAIPNTEYRILFDGKPWVFKTPSGEVKEHSKYLTVNYIAQALGDAAEGNNVVIPPLRWELDPEKPYQPPVVHKDDSNDFNAYYEAMLEGDTFVIKSKDGNPITMRIDSARVYINTSISGVLQDVSKLPHTLPTLADGVVYGVGDKGSTLTYYQYSHSESRWLEVAIPGSPTGILNMPVELYWDGDTWVLEESAFEGKLSGDDETNPDPAFVDWGITGIASYQGRLVLMSGSWVLLSATNKPRVFYRTTVEELLDTDPIEIGSSAAGSASFKYGLVFNRDLLIFSPEHQALIPGMAQAITPKNAHILVTSTYTADMTCEPITLGSSIMYPMPRSSTHFGIQEMLPSAYTDSMYMSVDATEHIPTYLEGRCRFAVASTVGNMALFASSTDRRVLLIHEYLWSGDEKVLKSWHKWEYPYDIAHAYFAGGLINLVLVDPDTSNIILVDLDPKAGDGTVIETRNYYLDMHRLVTVVQETKPYINVPKDFWAFCKAYDLIEHVRVAHYGGDLNSMEIGADPIVVEDGTPRIYLNPSTTASKVVIGFSYVSRFIPGSPVFKDFKERVITFNRVQLMKMYTLTNRTGIYEVSIIDKDRSFDKSYEVNPVRWLSTELNLGKLPVAGTIGNVIPCRIDAHSGEVEFRSVGLTEMNIINIEYTCKAGVMRQRR